MTATATRAGLAAFGTAVEWASRLRNDPALIATDTAGAADALLESLLRRRDGEVFAVAPFLSDRREVAVSALGAALFSAASDVDVRHDYFDQLAADRLVINDTPFAQYGHIDHAHQATLRDLVEMSDAVVVRSSHDVRRLRDIFAAIDMRVPLRVPAILFAPADPRVPRVRCARDARTVLVWAPERPIEALVPFILALEELRAPATILCAGGTPPAGIRTRVVGVADAALELQAAAVVVAAEPYDPGTAYALAECAPALAVASTCGADEGLDGVAVFDPWNWRSIAAAVLDAAGGGPPRRLPRPDDETELQARLRPRRAAAVTERAPLVSIVVPTYNRRSVLPISLDSLERQSYPNLEIVVVRNGGADVADVVARYPRARVVDRAENEGASGGINAGLTVARGAFLGVLSDDDRYYPDHVTRLVEALERTGAAMAHSIAIQSIFEKRADRYELIGARITYDRAVLARDLRVCNYIQNAVLWRRSAFPDALFCVEVDSAADFELWLQFARTADFIHVPRVTAEISMRRDGSNYSYAVQDRNTRVYQTIYERHPVDGPKVLADRAAYLAGLVQPMVPVSPPVRFPDSRARELGFAAGD